MTSKSNPAARSFGPDLIRATAIMCVVLSHTMPGLTTFASVRAVRNILGFVGVEIFFVLSGYLIGGILLKQLSKGTLDSISGLAVFWKRRWFRTLPNYYLFLSFNLLLAFYLTGGLPPNFSKFLWFGEAVRTEHPRFFTEAWSLAVEEWFYLCFPLLLWLLIKVGKNRSRAFWIGVATLLCLPVALRTFLWFGDWDNGLRKVTIFRLDAIMFGVIVAFLRLQKTYWGWLRRIWPVGVVSIIGLFSFVSIKGDMNVESFFDRVIFFTLVSLSLSLIFPSLVELKPPRRIFDAPIRKISLWSYSMYLSHALLAQIFATLFLAFGHSVHGFNAVYVSALDWIATLTISALVYSFFEKPLMELRERSFTSFLKPGQKRKSTSEGHPPTDEYEGQGPEAAP